MWRTAVIQLREVLKQPFVSGSQHVASEHPIPTFPDVLRLQGYVELYPGEG
jgi:hypothetical protein